MRAPVQLREMVKGCKLLARRGGPLPSAVCEVVIKEWNKQTRASQAAKRKRDGGAVPPRKRNRGVRKTTAGSKCPPGGDVIDLTGDLSTDASTMRKIKRKYVRVSVKQLLELMERLGEPTELEDSENSEGDTDEDTDKDAEE